MQAWVKSKSFTTTGNFFGIRHLVELYLVSKGYRYDRTLTKKTSLLIKGNRLSDH
jgi:hypothetical protein